MRLSILTIRPGQAAAKAPQTVPRRICRLRTHLRMRVAFTAVSITLLQIGAAQRANAQLVVGTTYGSGNAFPFSSGYSGEYEQVYSSSAFSGPVLISQIAFASAPTNSPAGAFSFTGTLSLGTTGATPTSMASNYAGNQRPDLTTVYSGTDSTTLFGTNTFDLFFNVTPFLYNPALGNLLLDVVNSGTYSPLANGPFFDSGVNQSGDELQEARLYNNAGNGIPTVDIEDGLVTRFTLTVNSAASAPEPSALLLLLLTVPACGALVTRQRNRRL